MCETGRSTKVVAEKQVGCVRSNREQSANEVRTSCEQPLKDRLSWIASTQVGGELFVDFPIYGEFAESPDRSEIAQDQTAFGSDTKI